MEKPNTAVTVAVVIVTYNGIKWVDKCLGSIRQSQYPVATIVIDNGSTDGTAEKIAATYPEVKLISPNQNLGFGGANNIGMRTALEEGFDYVFLLNQDAWLENDTIGRLVEVAVANTAFGIVSPIHVNGANTALDLNLSYNMSPDKCPGLFSDIYYRTLKPIYEIEFVNAAAWLISAACINKVGYFDPIFFLYGEDNNYLQRTKFHGFKIGITPFCQICHDREIRKGAPNKTGIKREHRTLTLITLLNIQQSFPKCLAKFVWIRVNGLLRSIYKRNGQQFKAQFIETGYAVWNMGKLLKARRKY
ncbi:GT2 family glycosyltransferase [Chitinophaga terrae (ex Kim and Jung 2007)]|uniref:glycosyltransferase family 2 protein n=1 Tax=Chitinophaga terrae (ex Kim and Jung 2007) TaxID=408074 RepID=UPI00277DE8D9|nr:glycosyltransferase family 2 protein [Chitinophaga terrae (ex Kim and Jung 2007)]MDQ0105775.1 GT2 family glycosyltransferase [Chitinophaga terrae (ex Kim and Jung 2007)]